MPEEWSLIESGWNIIVVGGVSGVLFLLVVAFTFEWIVPGRRVTKIEQQSKDLLEAYRTEANDRVKAAEKRAEDMQAVAFETARIASRSAQTTRSLIEAVKE